METELETLLCIICTKQFSQTISYQLKH